MILPSTNRRLFLRSSGLALGSVALGNLLHAEQGVLTKPHHAPKAKRIIYLFMAGGPSQMDSFDHKPKLNELHGQELPDSVRKGQRLTGMSGNQSTLPLAGSAFKFSEQGANKLKISDLLPNTAKMIDDLCVVRSMHTEAINHDPAITFFQTGHQLAGRPSFGAWLSYGLGSANENLPAFTVLVSKDKTEQGLYARLWGNGFLESRHQGVQFRSGKEPVLFLDNPAGTTPESRRKMLDKLAELQKLQSDAEQDPDTMMIYVFAFAAALWGCAVICGRKLPRTTSTIAAATLSLIGILGFSIQEWGSRDIPRVFPWWGPWGFMLTWLFAGLLGFGLLVGRSTK